VIATTISFVLPDVRLASRAAATVSLVALVTVGATLGTEREGTAVAGIAEGIVARTRVRSARMIAAWRPGLAVVVAAMAAGRYSSLNPREERWGRTELGRASWPGDCYSFPYGYLLGF
jgi:hypothetical protein